MSNPIVRTTTMGEEQVGYTPDASNPDRFKPQIEATDGTVRSFEVEDVGRIMDYEGLTQGSAGAGGHHSNEPITEGGLMICEYSGGQGTDGLSFTVYYCFLRGGFLFYFEFEDIEDQGTHATFLDSPVGVIPLDNVEVEYPPGGRRVFREHAHTDARTGYEFAIAHVPKASSSGGDESQRPPVFLVADSLGRRERWAKALRARAELASRPTLLKGGYTKISAAPSKEESHALSKTKSTKETSVNESSKYSDSDDEKDDTEHSEHQEQAERYSSTRVSTSRTMESAGEPVRSPAGRGGRTPTGRGGPGRGLAILKKRAESKATLLRVREENIKSVQQHISDAASDEGLAKAVVEFGVVEFREQDWMDNFFEVHNDFDAPSKLREMEEWQTLMKKNLKGAVLEQYEYFVQASGQMTTMGREVQSLKALIETQVQLIREMKEIDFATAMRGDFDKDEIMGQDDADKPDSMKDSFRVSSAADDRSAFSELSDNGQADADDIEDDPNAPLIDVPEWLLGAVEEITAFVRECRYADSIDLLLKSRAEILDLFDKHERPTAYRLRKAQVVKLRDTSKELESLGTKISNRLEEALRRKNEALRQAAKRERADAHAAQSTMISPCAVSDDTLYLQLLVKLGRNYQAAEAYSSRRTQLLLETLHERPIAGSGTVDLVIYAAQLSQSFFSVLASSVEGFLDLFLVTSTSTPAASSGSNGNNDENMSTGDSSSIHSVQNNSKSMPSAAIAAVVLWCDGELSKFAAAFGGPRILSNLALSPPPSASLMEQKAAPRVIGQDNDVGKERQNAIQVAAQCLNQAFQHASSNLDAVGLPLTPRLAEYLRMRLKGCEAEIAQLLDERWHGFTNEWRVLEGSTGIVSNTASLGIE